MECTDARQRWQHQALSQGKYTARDQGVNHRHCLEDIPLLRELCESMSLGHLTSVHPYGQATALEIPANRMSDALVAKWNPFVDHLCFAKRRTRDAELNGIWPRATPCTLHRRKKTSPTWLNSRHPGRKIISTYTGSSITPITRVPIDGATLIDTLMLAS